MSDSEIYKLIFAPGFSTAETVTNVSGRGVGLDVVKNNIERLRGNIEISSTPNEETLFRISLPLTTAISEGIIVFVDGHRFIFPIYQIEGFTQLNPSTVTTITKDREVVQIRDEFIPLIRMGSVTTQIRNKIKGTTLDQKAESRTINTRIENKTIVIVECKGKKYALMVDSLGGQTQVVVKSLGDKFKAINLVTGGAIMGDGRVSLVLNITGIIDLYIREYQPNNANKGNFKKIEMVA